MTRPTCDTAALIAFAKDAEVSANGPIPVTVRIDGEDDSTYYDVQIIGKKGQTFQLVATPQAEAVVSVSEGDSVRAFHPREMGVVRDGTVVKVGRNYVHVDFGELRGGVFRVAPKYIVEAT